MKDYQVRVWMSDYLYTEKPTEIKLDFTSLVTQGITDIILNELEVYLLKKEKRRYSSYYE